MYCFIQFSNVQYTLQGFPQVLRTWGGGALQNLMGWGGGLKSIHGVGMGGLKCYQKIPVKEFT